MVGSILPTELRKSLLSFRLDIILALVNFIITFHFPLINILEIKRHIIIHQPNNKEKHNKRNNNRIDLSIGANKQQQVACQYSNKLNDYGEFLFE